MMNADLDMDKLADMIADKIREKDAAEKAARRVERAEKSDWTRMTFIGRKDHLEALREYADAHRMTVKEALDQALEKFLPEQ